MLTKPKIERLGNVATVLPMPLSTMSNLIINNSEYGCVYLDGTKKSEAVVVSKYELLENDSKAKAFAIVGTQDCPATYLEFVLHSVPNHIAIEKSREQRKLSVRIVEELLVPMITADERFYIERLGQIEKELHRRGEWDIHAELGALCLSEVAVAIDAELILYDMCAENNVHILDRWITLIQHLRADMLYEVLPHVLMRPGNTLMAEVRTLQRIVANRNKARQDGTQD